MILHFCDKETNKNIEQLTVHNIHKVDNVDDWIELAQMSDMFYYLNKTTKVKLKFDPCQERGAVCYINLNMVKKYMNMLYAEAERLKKEKIKTGICNYCGSNRGLHENCKNCGAP